MCGISGLFAFKEGLIDTQCLINMTNIISHRGPNGEGFVVWQKNNSSPSRFGGPDTPIDVYKSSINWKPTQSTPEDHYKIISGLGHRRLSILDLSAGGHQPMKCNSSNVEIVFNGEIYNYEDVRLELKRNGYNFTTNSDTEVVLNAWKKWGKQCLEKFNGMFAIIIYDYDKNKIFVARDRFGVKPIYYWVSKLGYIAFASEIKQFTVLPGWQPKLNSQRAYDFLNYAITDHTSETLFSDVYQLRGGELIETTINNLSNPQNYVEKWYTLTPGKVNNNYETACNEFRDLFFDAVKLRKHADVPVGTGLSGGIDSSSIVCAINEINKKTSSDINHTFTACSKDPRFDEKHFADVVINHTGSKPHFTYPTLENFLQNFKTIIWHHDEPAVGATVFAEWEVYKLVSSTNVKVTLDGHGADEQLGGYHSFFKPFFTELFSKGKIIKLYNESNFAKIKHGYNKTFVAKNILDIYTPDFIKQKLGLFLGKVTSKVDWMEVKQLKIREYNLINEYGGKTKNFQKFSQSQILFTSLPQQLRWCDRDSMAHGIESRAPFLDYRLLEYSLGCNSDFKINQATTKSILRDSMKNYLPTEISNRQDKKGFITPEFAWIREDSPNDFIELVKKAMINTEGILNKKAQSKAIDIILGKKPFDFFVWRLLFFSAWIELYKIEK